MHRSLVVVVLSVGLLSSCAKSPTVVEAPPGAASEASRKPASAEGSLRLLSERVADGRAQALMALVRPIHAPGSQHIACSATFITEHDLLTAAHCIAGRSEEEAMPMVGGISLANTEVACGHEQDGSCATPFPEDPWRMREDVAVIHQRGGTSLSESLRLGTMAGDLPEVYMLSKHHGGPRQVCRAATSGGVASSGDEIERGDSGSALVAFDKGDAGWILGVVSHRDLGGHRLQAAMLPAQLPWRDAWPSAPQVDEVSIDQFARIPECP